MFKKIVTTAARILIICLAAEAIRQVWNPDKEKEEEKKENK